MPTLNELQYQRERLKTEKLQLADKIAENERQIIEHVNLQMVTMRHAQNKDFGAVSFELEGYKITHTIPKKVTYDQIIMGEIRQRIKDSGQDPGHWMEAKYTISETAWKGFQDCIKAAFLPARTVTPGKETIKLEVKT